MTWKVKDLKELLEDKHNEDVVQFFEFDYGSEGYTSIANIGRINTRKPKRNEFEHSECKYCEEITVRDVKQLYCCKDKDIVYRHSGSCDNFQHKKYELEYSD